MERPTAPAPAAEPRDAVQIEQVARTFYSMLTTEGFTSDQIVHLANDLLEMVGEEIRATPPPGEHR